MKTFILIFFWPFLAFTHAEPTVQEKLGQAFEDAKQAHKDFTKQAENTRSEKAYFGALEWTPLDLFIPVKWGAHIGINTNPNKSWELEYIRGSVSVPFIVDDLGSITDERVALTARHYFGGTFNLFYGLDYMRFRINLGDKLLSSVSAGALPSIDVVETTSYGAHVGFGNRWALNENILLGVDWFAWTQPLYTSYKKDSYLNYVSDEADADDVQDVLKIAQYFPRFTVFRLHLGISF